jgi:hypothetical protein
LQACRGYWDNANFRPCLTGKQLYQEVEYKFFLFIFYRKQQQSERETLDEQLNTLRKEKEDLRIKVNDLTRKNEVIQESIRQKIKGSVYM